MERRHTLELYWDFSSPFAYLATTQAAALAKRTGAELIWRPMLLGGLFQAIDQESVPLFSFSPAKQQYLQEDLKRWAAYWKVPFKFPAHFPLMSLKPLRVWLALPEEKRDAFRAAAMVAYWGEGKDISNDAVLTELLGDGAAAVLARTQDPTIKQALVDATKAAAAAGVFGAPTWVIDGKDLYWGQDRIPLLEHALKG